MRARVRHASHRIICLDSQLSFITCVFSLLLDLVFVWVETCVEFKNCFMDMPWSMSKWKDMLCNSGSSYLWCSFIGINLTWGRNIVISMLNLWKKNVMTGWKYWTSLRCTCSGLEITWRKVGTEIGWVTDWRRMKTSWLHKSVPSVACVKQFMTRSYSNLLRSNPSCILPVCGLPNLSRIQLISKEMLMMDERAGPVEGMPVQISWANNR